MKNILLNTIKFLAGAFSVAGCGLIATNTIYISVAAICWLGVAVGVWNMLDGIKSVIKK